MCGWYWSTPASQGRDCGRWFGQRFVGVLKIVLLVRKQGRGVKNSLLSDSQMCGRSPEKCYLASALPCLCSACHRHAGLRLGSFWGCFSILVFVQVWLLKGYIWCTWPCCCLILLSWWFQPGTLIVLLSPLCFLCSLGIQWRELLWILLLTLKPAGSVEAGEKAVRGVLNRKAGAEEALLSSRMP